jgi:hypothetical protein
MDRSLIAPGPDMVWHTNRRLDGRIPGEAQLIELKGQPVIEPQKKRFGPRAGGLEYRLEKLA